MLVCLCVCIRVQYGLQTTPCRQSVECGGKLSGVQAGEKDATDATRQINKDEVLGSSRGVTEVSPKQTRAFVKSIKST